MAYCTEKVCTLTLKGKQCERVPARARVYVRHEANRSIAGIVEYVCVEFPLQLYACVQFACLAKSVRNSSQIRSHGSLKGLLSVRHREQVFGARRPYQGLLCGANVLVNPTL